MKFGKKKMYPNNIAFLIKVAFVIVFEIGFVLLLRKISNERR